MHAARLAHADVIQAVRQGGYGDISQVGAVILEANGRFSVISGEKLEDASALRSLQRGARS